MATRRERVVLDLESNLPEGMLRGAAATQVLRMELNRLSGQSVITARASASMSRDMDKVSTSAGKADKSINQLTGRLRLFADAAAVLGPALVPLGGVAVAGIAGLASQMGFAAVAGGVLIGSMQGLGEALTLLNKADLNPTAENLAKAEDALNRLSPAAAAFAREANDLAPILRGIRDMGAEGLFPGLSEALDDFERLAPVVGGIFESVGGALGDIASGGAASLASDRWADFFEFIKDEAPQAISELASTVGSLTHGLGELWMAFGPLNSDASAWVMDVADSFDRWAEGLSQTQGFQEFIDYIRETGPQVAETLGALGNLFVQIVQAAAPLGGPTLMALEAIADAAAAIADSNLGTPLLAAASAMALLSRATATYAAVSKTALGGRAVAGIKTMGAAMDTTAIATRRATTSVTAFHGANKAALVTAGKSAALLGGIAVASSGAADGMGLTNTASLALMGTIAGPWGAAVGGGVGLMLDMKAATEQAEQRIVSYKESLEAMTLAELEAEDARLAILFSKENRVGTDPDSTGSDPVQLVKDQTAATSQLEAAERRAAIALARRAGVNLDVANTAEMSVKKLEEMTKALRESREAAREAGRATASSFGLLGESLDDAKVSLNGWLAEQEAATRALARFNDNSVKAAREGLDKGLIKSLREMGVEGALRMDQLANGTKSGIDRANANWRAMQREIKRTERLTLDLLGLSPARIKVDAETKAANAALDSLEARLNAMQYHDVFINVRHNPVDTGLGPVGSADGSFVPKTGKPYADRHHYLLADGEGVTTNRRGETDRFRDVITGINRGYSRSAIKGMLADGGFGGGMGSSPSPVSRTPDERLALLEAIRSVRDLQRELAKDGKERLSGLDRKVAMAQLAAAKQELDSVRSQPRRDDGATRLEASMESLAAKLETQTEALEVQTQSLAEWSSKMADVAAATVAGFSSGLFDESSNPWESGAGSGPMFNLNKDIAGLEERGALQEQLAALGLSGDALGALLAQGDNTEIWALIDSGGVGQYASAYQQRADLQGSVGTAAGQAAYGTQYAAQAAITERQAVAVEASERKLARIERHLAAMQDSLADAPERTGDRVGNAVNGPATGAAVKGRDRKPRKPR